MSLDDVEVVSKQPTSDDAGSAVKDVIPLAVPHCHEPCDHGVAQTPSATQQEVLWADSLDLAADRSSSEAQATSQVFHDNLVEIPSPILGSATISGDAEADSAASLPSSLASPSSTTPITPRTPTSRPSSPLRIPEMSSLSNLALHSPSSHIVGTPFATNSAPFEYPFPASPTPGNGSSSVIALTSISRSPSPAIPALFSFPSSARSDPTNTLVLSLSMAIPSDIPSTQLPITHPKMRTTPPPVPPALVKRRQEMLQARRGSNAESVRSAGDVLHHSSSDSHLSRKSAQSPHGEGS